MNKKILLTALTLSLCGCSMMPEWIGGGEEDAEKITGERISVLKTETTVTADKSLDSVAVNIPDAAPNDKWLKSNGYTPQIQNISAPAKFSRKKSYDIGKGDDEINAGSNTVIADGKIFTIDLKGSVLALDVNNPSKKIWKFTIEAPKDDADFANAGILYYEGKVYLTSGYNLVIALNADNGTLLWRRTISSIARSAPDASGDKIFVNTADNKVFALNANDGAIEWVHEGVSEDMSIFGSSSPLAAGDRVFAPYSSGELYTLRTTDGSQIWAADLTRSGNSSFLMVDIDAAPVVDGNVVYSISNDGVLSAIDMATGQDIWEKEVSGSKTPWIAGDFIYLINDQNELVSIEKYTGGIKWVSNLPSYKKPKNKKSPINWNGPVMGNGRLIVVGSNGELYAISPQNGDIIEKTKIPEYVNMPPVIANGAIYLISDTAKLIVVN